MSGYEKSAQLYDHFDHKDNIGFFYHHTNQVGKALDIGAGTGRIAIPLAERGINVTCVEPSPAMRAVFESKLSAHPLLAERIQLYPNDARSFSINDRFPLAYLSGTFDHFLDDEERLASLSNIANHLEPKGILIFDVFLGLMKDSPLIPAGEIQVGDTVIRRFISGKILPGNLKETTLIYEVYQGEELIQRIEEHSLVGLTDHSNIRNLLQNTGFEVYAEWSVYDFTPYQSGDDLLIVEAKKC